jgi:hypothetical protein
VRVPTGFSSNISKQVSVKDLSMYGRLQFSRLSCNDDDFSRNCNNGHQSDAYQSNHHMLMLLFNIVSQKVIGHKEMDDLKVYIIETMCMLEM